MDVDTSSDDSNQTLSQIAQKHGRSIVDMLVDIQESVVPQSKSISFLERLECLQPIGYPYDNPPQDARTGKVIPPRSTDDPAVEYKFMRRCHVNVLDLPGKDRDYYVALSYIWQPQDGEDKVSGRYWIENKQQTGFDMSPVRNTVLDRITNRMSALNYRNLWIDQHCITQTTTCTRGNCSHEDCNEKRDAVHAMDLVYSASNIATALLSHYIEGKYDLLLLSDLLNVENNLMEPDPPRTDGEPNYRIPTRAILSIKLVYDIISDPWWARAWTFQEDILATPQMEFLLRHAPDLEDLIPTTSFGKHFFHRTPGELCIKSHNFSFHASSLCMVVLQELEKLTEGRVEMLRDEEIHWLHMILEIQKAIAGKTERDGRMDRMCVVASFPEIIEKKGIAKFWDRLAIIGNCCRFSTRLEPLELHRQGHSISISALALFLLNGEVLDNEKERTVQDVSSMKASRYLATQLLDNKHYTSSMTGDCRLPDVVLTTQGVRTRGHLWQLGEIIRLSEVEDKEDDSPGQDQLRKIIRALEDLGYTALATDLKAFLGHPTSKSLLFPDQLAQCEGRSMTTVIATIYAITQGCPIRLGRIWDPNVPDDKSLYHTLFVLTPDEMTNIQLTTPPLVFSSTVKINPSPRPNDEMGRFQRIINVIRRHSYQYAVLQVEVDDGSFKNDTPPGGAVPVTALRTQRWANGICFPNDTPPREVVFPWPDELLKVVPNQDGQEVGHS